MSTAANWWDNDPVVTSGLSPTAKWWEDDPVVSSKSEANRLSAVPARSNRSSGALNAAARGLVDGVPVVGPYLLSGIDRADAALRAATNDTRYSDEMANARDYDVQLRAEHPVASTAGEIAGGIVGVAPLVAAAPAAFGAGAGSMLGRSALSAASGLALGGSDAAVRSGGDPREIARGAVTGAALGGVAPTVGAAVGAGAGRAYEAVASRLLPSSGFSPAATRVLAEDVASSGGVGRVRGRLDELGPDSMLLDASPSLQGQAQGLAVRPETREAVAAPVMARTAGASARLDQDVNAALGPARSPQTITVDLRGQRMAPNDAIGAAIDNAPGPVSARPILQMIDQRIGQARGSEEAVLKRARSMLAQEDRQTGWVTIADDPRVLHNVKQEMDTLINYGAPDLGVQGGAQARQGSAAQMVRSQLNSLLRSKVPGYADANDASAALARQIEATQRGSELLRSGEAATAPADFARQLAAMSPAEREAMAGATRGVIDQAVGTKPNDLAALQSVFQVDPRSGQGGWNAQNLAQLHGQEPVDRIVSAVNRERTFTDADNAIVRNSQTAQRQQAADRIAPRNTLGDDLGATMAGAVGGPKAYALAQAARAAKAGINAIGRSADTARNRELARAVTLQPSDILDVLLNSLEARVALQQRAAALGASTGRGVQTLVLSQGDRERSYAPFGLAPVLR